MTPTRRRRLLMVLGLVAGVGVATALAFQAFQDNLFYFYSPSQMADGEAPPDRVIRVGGLVQEGSIAREPGSLTVNFLVTDHASTIPVSYTGVLPDLFREGQGVVARGQVRNGVFKAENILAKHDENYMPPEVAEALHRGEMRMRGIEAPTALPSSGYND